MSHINIQPTTDTIYWILQNITNSNYLSGSTQIGQTTEANDNWTIYLSTTNRTEWENECILLDIEYDTSA